VRYFSGVLYLFSGGILLALGYSKWLRYNLETMGIPSGDIGSARVMGYIFLFSGLIYITYKLFQNRER
jgi:hypothetical protein